MGNFKRSGSSSGGHGRDSGRPSRKGFGKSKDFAGSRGFDSERPRRSSIDNGPHEVICAKCGITTDVPFKPTNNKPVFCRNCFKKKDYESERSGSFDRSNRRSEKTFDAPRAAVVSGASAADLAEINRKLDMIIEALEIDDE